LHQNSHEDIPSLNSHRGFHLVPETGDFIEECLNNISLAYGADRMKAQTQH
jgi:hypothetical protein